MEMIAAHAHLGKCKVFDLDGIGFGIDKMTALIMNSIPGFIVNGSMG